MSISIREAIKSDYNSLLPLFRQVHELHVYERPDLYKENSTPVGQGFFESQLADARQHIFVATIGNEIVGIVVMKEEDIIENSFVKARKILYINSLCVAETKRNKGIGKRLLQYVFEFGRSLNVESIELGVSERNSSAIKFYESVGMATKSRKMEIILD
ncbi:GNAT family N-acetyltransferase [Sutcliffiella horikoshii]|uniref:GNAT family N-acetyltransferase n=1 Tax=Sutcliffiella horikoshii TaxID=79883 RepID=A0A5D4SXM2_9BACI|nr:GNAT family N-acetyltransferase [Sutcliffiella horikoshii]TYS68123.1 GNAT family N-acetyltransferase [Sutcliffiella horikoshii]